MLDIQRFPNVVSQDNLGFLHRSVPLRGLATRDAAGRELGRAATFARVSPLCSVVKHNEIIAFQNVVSGAWAAAAETKAGAGTGIRSRADLARAASPCLGGR